MRWNEEEGKMSARRRAEKDCSGERGRVRRFENGECLRRDNRVRGTRGDFHRDRRVLRV